LTFIRPFRIRFSWSLVMLSPFVDSRSVPVRLASSLLAGGVMAVVAIVVVIVG